MISYGIKHDIGKLLFNLRIISLQHKWRNINKHNSTEITTIVPIEKIHVGKGTYGQLNIQFYNRSGKRGDVGLIIGNYCSIATSAMFMVGGGHYFNHVSSFPFNNMLTGEEESIATKSTIIDDDVWIGERATIMSGVHIGQGAVIGATALVNRDVPPYAIVGGVPAKVIKYRFSPEVIDELMKIDYSKIEESDIKTNIDSLYTEISTVEDAKKLTSWMPKKI